MRGLLWALGLAVLSCGGDGGTGLPAVASVEVAPESWLSVGVGDTVRFRASALDAIQRPIADAHPTWAVDDTTIAVVDDRGLATARGTGVTRVVAQVGEVTADALLEVYVPPEVGFYQPGVGYLGRRGYVEYVPGTLPLVISVPHGGDLEPAGDTGPDVGRDGHGQLDARDGPGRARSLRRAYRKGAARGGLDTLRRTKLDPNRDIAEAAQGSPFAENAWHEFQGFIDIAEATVEEEFGSGLYVDVHGHGHEILRAELGYLLSADDLDRSDDVLDAGGYAERSSLRAIASTSDAPFSELLRGASSLGGLLAAQGVAAVPSPVGSVPRHGTLLHRGIRRRPSRLEGLGRRQRRADGASPGRHPRHRREPAGIRGGSRPGRPGLHDRAPGLLRPLKRLYPPPLEPHVT